MAEWFSRSYPHCGHWHEVEVMLRLMVVVDMGLGVVVRRLVCKRVSQVRCGRVALRCFTKYFECFPHSVV